MVFVFLRLIRFVKKLNYKSVVSYSSIFGVVVLGYIFIDKILKSLYSLLLRYGIRSRSISLFLRDSVHLSGRSEIYDLVINEIARNPLIGIGIAGDRLLIGGGYVHNFFIEIIGNFGIIIGSILAIALIIIMLRPLASKELIKYNMVSIWISLGFVSLMVSGSYLESMNFWILLGLLVNFNRVSLLNRIKR